MSCHVTQNEGISTDVNDINIVKKYENHMKNRTKYNAQEYENAHKIRNTVNHSVITNNLTT